MYRFASFNSLRADMRDCPAAVVVVAESVVVMAGGALFPCAQAVPANKSGSNIILVGRQISGYQIVTSRRREDRVRRSKSGS